jgi:hypothetical protein
MASRTRTGDRSAPQSDCRRRRRIGGKRASWISGTGDKEPRSLNLLYNARPTWLDLAHAKLDAAVAAAYGWPADLTDDAILERLLALNQAAAT